MLLVRLPGRGSVIGLDSTAHPLQSQVYRDHHEEDLIQPFVVAGNECILDAVWAMDPNWMLQEKKVFL